METLGREVEWKKLCKKKKKKGTHALQKGRREKERERGRVRKGMRERDKREGRARVTGELGSVHLLAA